MKRNLFLSILAGVSLSAMAMPSPAEIPDVITPDSTGFQFTDIISLPTGPVKNQNKSGTCWCFAGTSLLEEDVLRKGGPELDLSEMYWVRQNYIDKARKYMRMNGTINFAQGGSIADVLETAQEYGAVPEEVYSGLNYGDEKHSHYEMFDALQGYLNGILAGKRNLSDAWLRGFTAVLNEYLGTPPEEFTYKGKKYTPQSFAKEFKITPADFVTLTSYTHHPFNTWIQLEIPDNWRWTESYNVPLDKLKKAVDDALAAGYTVGWGADVSEPGWLWKKGYALIPEEKGPEDLTENEAAKWDQLSDKERKDLSYKISGPVKEKTITQEDRQKHFDNFESTDDHGMVIVGVAEDQEGNRYYKVKNSWDTNQLYGGFIYVSEPYFLDKTINVTLHRDVAGKLIGKK
ncbi:MAG: aminopeptidase [Muribaculaceae bacterium]|nr:aminopeptidase [Muribaculaceae bacterium]